jgi:hypothetical protein
MKFTVFLTDMYSIAYYHILKNCGSVTPEVADLRLQTAKKKIRQDFINRPMKQMACCPDVPFRM